MKTTPNHKRGSTSVKATTSCFNYGQVGHFANRCPNLRQLLTPTQFNQTMAWTPAYKKCYSCGQKSHFANVCPNQQYHPDVTTVATSTPNCQVNSTMSSNNSSKGSIQPKNKAMQLHNAEWSNTSTIFRLLLLGTRTCRCCMQLQTPQRI
jgi:hypothetical protein